MNAPNTAPKTAPKTAVASGRRIATAAPADPLFQNYRRAPLAFARGEGCRLWDTEGREYLDLLAGIATCSLGHGHPGLVSSIQEQAARCLHVSNLFRIPEQEEAGRLLVEASGGRFSRAFFCNSGTEANEAAIKLARRWGSTAEPKRFKVISTHNAFHGRTLGALAATGTAAYRVGFEPLPEGFVQVPFDDLEALEEALDEQTCAVLLEGIQGEAGVIPSSPGYLEGVQALCRERGTLFVLDEIQTAIGRLGRPFGFQHFGVEPDVITLAKGLGGGVPVGAVLAGEEVAAVLVPGTHGTTFGGNPLAMAAVIAVQRALREEDLPANAAARGAQLRAGLEAIADRTGTINQVRGTGLMLAIETTAPAAPIADRCRELGAIVHAVRPTSIRLLPPLVIDEQEVSEGLGVLEQALEESRDEAGAGR
ncbi:MAG TPA: aspartate aminotransferase family protein [Thermoanaerobaculia bacterium]|nr:aspartate aminotransferase family protein [Thermoanaerobaculia bacterium]